MNVKNGFTLMEMLIVLAILSILTAVAYPSYAGHVVRTKRTEGQFALIDALQQQERYRLQHSTYAEFASAEDAEALGFRWWSGATAAASMYQLEAHACPGRSIAECVALRASPGTAKVDSRFRDAECGALTLDSVGVHAAEGAGRCWP